MQWRKIKTNLDATNRSHLKEVDQYYKQKIADKAAPKNSPLEKKCCIWTKTVPANPILGNRSYILLLSHGQSISFHDCDIKQAFCYMWLYKTITRRGGNQVPSCLKKFIENLPSEVETLTMYPNSYLGQNKNALLKDLKW